MFELREAGASFLYPPKIQADEGSHAKGVAKLPGALSFGSVFFGQAKKMNI